MSDLPIKNGTMVCLLAKGTEKPSEVKPCVDCKENVSVSNLSPSAIKKIENFCCIDCARARIEES